MMGGMSLIHWIILGGILLLVFGGRNKISDVMGDVAKGIKSFKKGLSDDDDKPAARPVEPVRSIDHYPAAPQQMATPVPQPVVQDPRLADPRATDPRVTDPRVSDPRVTEPHKAG